jgi:hypothetical protein
MIKKRRPRLVQPNSSEALKALAMVATILALFVTALAIVKF